MRKLLQREIILSRMILVFKLSWSFPGPLKQLLGVKKYPLGAWFLNCTLCSEQQTEKKLKIGVIVKQLEIKDCFYRLPLQTPNFWHFYSPKTLFMSAQYVYHYVDEILKASL